MKLNYPINPRTREEAIFAFMKLNAGSKFTKTQVFNEFLKCERLKKFTEKNGQCDRPRYDFGKILKREYKKGFLMKDDRYYIFPKKMFFYI